MEQQPIRPESSDKILSRRKFGAKLAYVPPAVLAMVKLSERPAKAGIPVTSAMRSVPH